MGRAAFSMGARLLAIVVKSPFYIAATAVLTVLVSLGLFLPLEADPGMGTPLSLRSYESALGGVNALLSDDFLESAPKRLVELEQQQRVALESAVGASTVEDFLSAAVSYYDSLLATARAGYLSTNTAALEGHRSFLLAFQGLEMDVLGYGSTLDAPALYYISAMTHVVPYYSFYLPLLVACGYVWYLRSGGRLFSRAPLPAPAAALVSAAVALIAGLGVALVSFVPGFAVSLARNGFGSSAYPVVLGDGAQAAWSTLGGALSQEVALFVAASVFIAALAMLCQTVFDRPIAGCALPAALLLLPTLPAYSDVAYSGLGHLVPATYFAAWTVTGYASFSPCMDVCAVDGVGVATGVWCCLALAAVCVAGAVVVSTVRDRRCGRA